MERAVGVDPGGTYTGVVTTTAKGICAACVITKETAEWMPDNQYIDEVLDEVARQAEGADLLAIEGINEPSGHIRMINVKGIIGTAAIYGAVLARWPNVLVVPPGGNGSNPDFAYPPEIRKYARLGGPSTHARSAYDVARTAMTMARVLRPKGQR